jgi:hypothetical protein
MYPYLTAEPVVLNSEGVEKVLKKNTQDNNSPLVTSVSKHGLDENSQPKFRISQRFLSSGIIVLILSTFFQGS